MQLRREKEYRLSVLKGIGLGLIFLALLFIDVPVSRAQYVPPTPTPTPTPTVTPGPTLQCPAGFDQKIIDSTIVCVQQIQNQTNNQTQTTDVSSSSTTGDVNVNVSAPTPVVQGAPQAIAGVSTIGEIKELPKTGLPLLVWGLAGLGPLGMGLIRKSKGSEDSQDNADSANYIWQKREISKD